MRSATIGRLVRDVRRLIARQARPVYVEYARPPATRLTGRTLRIAAITRLTPSAVSVTLEDPRGQPIVFVPGEFLTVLVSIDGTEYRRAYSICSSRRETGVRIGVKQVPGGRVSTHLCQQARVGDLVEVFGPSGAFAVMPDPAAARWYVLVAGGSGITPLLAIARAIVEDEPASSVALIYGNRSLDDAMFREELDDLARAASDRLVVRHVVETGGLPACGRHGRLTCDVLGDELDAIDARGPDGWYFLCGPEPMMDEARRALANRRVPADRIRLEHFTPAARARRPHSAAPQQVIVRQGAREYRYAVPGGATLLEAGRAAGVPIPFSCTVGGCGTCRARLMAGEADSDEPNCLMPDERAAGWLLTCVTRARSPIELELGPEPGSDRTNKGDRR